MYRKAFWRPETSEVRPGDHYYSLTLHLELFLELEQVLPAWGRCWFVGGLVAACEPQLPGAHGPVELGRPTPGTCSGEDFRAGAPVDSEHCVSNEPELVYPKDHVRFKVGPGHLRTDLMMSPDLKTGLPLRGSGFRAG